MPEALHQTKDKATLHAGGYEGSKGGTMPRAPNDWWSEKSQQCCRNTVHLFSGVTKLVSCPGRHVTSAHSCLHKPGMTARRNKKNLD